MPRDAGSFRLFARARPLVSILHHASFAYACTSSRTSGGARTTCRKSEEVARAILHAAEQPKRDVYVGSGSKMVSTLNRHFPALVDWMNRSVMAPRQVRDEPARHREGALQAAGEDGHVHGSYEGHVMQSSLYPRASLHPVATAALLSAAGFTLLALMSSGGNAATARHRLSQLRQARRSPRSPSPPE